MEKYLFHGSQCGTITELEPRISLEFKNLVYATEDYRYALVRAGKQLDLIREEYYGFHRPFELAECDSHAFERMFGCEGYVYLLDPNDFIQNPETLEYYSEKPVIPVKMIRIKNLWFEMIRVGGYEFHYNCDQEYWSHVRGGKWGFLERKMKNKQKMIELLEKGL